MRTLDGSSTNVDLGEFARSRARVQDALSLIREVALELRAQESAALLVKASAHLAEDRFRLVVAGEFNNGKSTLINALLGDRVLPSSASPTTVLLSVIQYGESPRYRIRRLDGSYEATTQDGFRKLVAPHEPDQRDPTDVERFHRETNTISAIDRVEIGYPTPLCGFGVEIVDTPGTNDPNAARERITYEFVPNADAVVFVLSARMPLDQSEMDFLRDRILASDVGRLFFAINFKDFLDTPEKQQKVLQYVEAHLGKIVDRPRIFLVCAKDALTHRAGGKSIRQPMPMKNTGFIELELALSDFLTNERGATKLARPISVGERIARELINGPIRMRRGAIGSSAAAISQRIAALHPDIASARREHAEVLQGLRSRLAADGSQIDEELKKGLDGVVRSGVAALDNYGGELTQEAISKAIESAIAKKHTEQIERARKRQAECLKAQCEAAQRRIEVSWAAVRLKVDAEFGTVGTEDVDLSDLTVNDATGFAVASGLGAIALAAFAHIAIPIAIIAGVLGFFGGGVSYEEAQRRKAIERVKPKVRDKLSEGIPTTVAAFSSGWQRASLNACEAFDAAFSARVDALESQLRALLDDRQGLLLLDDEERTACDQLEDRIRRQIVALRELRWQ